ncbi:uncharacterized protein LOC123950424 [Meles meles]|uniref:uncharacterized protein LOC123950424 n=1 Tax=Meles meles TaxID=9662 RepID=UPI001E69FDB6|nr:uncharacterized protein LOC123950424 [Meles meles]
MKTEREESGEGHQRGLQEGPQEAGQGRSGQARGSDGAEGGHAPPTPAPAASPARQSRTSGRRTAGCRALPDVGSGVELCFPRCLRHSSWVPAARFSAPLGPRVPASWGHGRGPGAARGSAEVRAETRKEGRLAESATACRGRFPCALASELSVGFRVERGLAVLSVEGGGQGRLTLPVLGSEGRELDGLSVGLPPDSSTHPGKAQALPLLHVRSSFLGGPMLETCRGSREGLFSPEEVCVSASVDREKDFSRKFGVVEKEYSSWDRGDFL